MDRNGKDLKFSMLNVFVITSCESLEAKLVKIKILVYIFGEDATHEVTGEWFRFKVQLQMVWVQNTINCQEKN